MPANVNYASIIEHSVLKDLYVPSGLDIDDPWSGYGRKDLLFYLYALYEEMDSYKTLRGKDYAQLSVSVARYNEIKKVESKRQMEHYTGIAADVYLPKHNTGVIIIDSKAIADILFSMGIHYIGIGYDYIHFDLAGDEDKVWSIGNYPAYTPKVVTLKKAAGLTISEAFR